MARRLEYTPIQAYNIGYDDGYKDGFEEGRMVGSLEMKEEMLDKAVRWLKDNKIRDDIVGYFLDTQREEMRDEFIEEFKKAMEE